MRATRTSSPLRSAIFLAETVLVPIGEVHPNTWNVNRMNAFQYAKLLESMQLYGMLDPLLTRDCPSHADYEIVGGKHRWQAATDLGYTHLPIIIREMNDEVARKISIIDNELHGQADPVALGELLKDLLENEGPVELLRGLPFDEDVLKGFLGFDPLPPLPAAPTPAGSPPPSPGSAAERWVERTYRIPESVASIIDQALARAKDGDPIEDWQALERVAADFLAS